MNWLDVKVSIRCLLSKSVAKITALRLKYFFDARDS